MGYFYIYRNKKNSCWKVFKVKEDLFDYSLIVVKSFWFYVIVCLIC